MIIGILITINIIHITTFISTMLAATQVLMFAKHYQEIRGPEILLLLSNSLLLLLLLSLLLLLLLVLSFLLLSSVALKWVSKNG